MAGKTVTVTIKATDSFSAVITQYEQKINGAAAATKRADDANRQMAGSFDGLKTAIAGTIAAIGVQQVISFAEDMNELGVQVHANRVLFAELTDEIGGQDRVLASLRESTGGVVDDMNLMAGASQLLRLNIVDNNRDLNELYGNIQKLKQPTESTADAIQNFALMLSNESLLRLDSFGISSANVKRRMDELGQTFREAVMSEMEVQVERLGDAAVVAETKFGKLVTQVRNFAELRAEEFAGKVEEISGALMGEDPLQIGTALLDQFGVSVSDFQTFAEYEQFARNAAAYQAAFKEQTLDAFHAITGGVEAAVDGVNRIFERQRQFKDLLGLPEGASASVESWFNTDTMEASMQRLRDQQAGMIGEIKLFTPEEESRAQGISNWLDKLKGDLKDLEGTDLVPPETVDRVTALAAEASKFADQVARGADAFRNMSLSQALGLDSGDVLGSDLEQKFLDAAKGADIDDEQLQAYKDALDLAFGSQTEFSMALDEYVGTLASASLPAEEITRRLDTLADSMRAVKEAGLESTLFLPGNLPLLTGSTQEGQMIPGFDPQQLIRSMLEANRTQVAPEDFFSTYGIDPFGLGGGEGGMFDASGLETTFETLTTSSDLMVEDAQLFSDLLSAGSDSLVKGADDFGTRLTELSGTTFNLKFKVSGLELIEKLVGMDLVALMASATQANGGTPPGQQPQGRSTRVIDR